MSKIANTYIADVVCTLHQALFIFMSICVLVKYEKYNPRKINPAGGGPPGHLPGGGGTFCCPLYVFPYIFEI